METKQKITRFIKSDLWIVFLDIIAVNAAYLLALNARFIGYDNLGELFQGYLHTLFAFAPIYSIICIAIFALFRLYNGMWKYAGTRDLDRILVASLITGILYIIITRIFYQRMPLTYYVLGAGFQVIFICAIRLGYRVYNLERAKVIRHLSPAENVMIIGAGWNAKNLMDFLERDHSRNLKPVCIVDNEQRGMDGKSINGVPVIGGPEMLEKGIEKYKVSNIYIANPMLDNELREKLEKVCKERYLNLRDYAGYIAYMNQDIPVDTADALLRIVKPPIKVQDDGKRVIPFSPPDISEKEIGEVVEALRSGWITTGPRTKLLERRLAAFIETGKTDVDTEKEPPLEVKSTVAEAWDPAAQGSIAPVAVPTPVPAENEPQEPVYILPTDTELIEIADLEQMTHDETYMAINEIYARHGLIFETVEIQEYFEAQSWYNGTTTDSQAIVNEFSDIELNNLGTIVTYQYQMGYRVEPEVTPEPTPGEDAEA